MVKPISTKLVPPGTALTTLWFLSSPMTRFRTLTLSGSMEPQMESSSPQAWTTRTCKCSMRDSSYPIPTPMRTRPKSPRPASILTTIKVHGLMVLTVALHSTCLSSNRVLSVETAKTLLRRMRLLPSLKFRDALGATLKLIRHLTWELSPIPASCTT